jgi:hypothetical protein
VARFRLWEAEAEASQSRERYPDNYTFVARSKRQTVVKIFDSLVM